MKFASSRRRSAICRRALALALPLGLLCAGWLSAAPASADVNLCSAGSGAGQCAAPKGLALDRSEGLLYVADSADNRIEVFDAATNTFLHAFGWGVADGVSAELQTCATTCFAGLAGGGAGEFDAPARVAVDNDPSSPAYHDLYVFERFRVQRFSFDENATPGNFADDFAVFEGAWGGGTISAGAKGSGDLSSGSKLIANVKTTQQAFATGQAITGAGIPAGARVLELGPGTMTISKAAEASASGVELSVAEGTGNVAVDEVQELPPSITNLFGICFTTPNPSPTSACSSEIPPGIPASGPGSLEEILLGFFNIEPGDVSVSGPDGGPYTVSFEGRYADTDVKPIVKRDSQGNPSTEAAGPTIENGHSATEACAPAHAAECAAGVEAGGHGQFAQRDSQVAVGPEGLLYVADQNRVQRFEASGAFAGQAALPSGGLGEAKGLALDSGGRLYLSNSTASETGAAVRKYEWGEPSATLLSTFEPSGPGALATDTADDLFVADRIGGGGSDVGGAIAEWSPAGVQQRAIYGSLRSSAPTGIAAYHGAGGELFASEAGRVVQIPFPAPGTVPPAPVILRETTTSGEVRSARATLQAEVNPEGKPATCHFEYVDDATYQADKGSGDGFQHATSSPGFACGEDFLAHKASQKEEGLAPETTYHFRIVAKNEGGETKGEEGATFKTLKPIEIEAAWATEVGLEGARLHAQLDPLGTDATGYFEYVDEATFQESGFEDASKAPVGTLDFGSGEGPATRATLLTSLAPNTAYRYRIVAEDHCKPFPEEDVVCTFAGEALRFTTFWSPPAANTDCPNQAFRTGPSAALPDCRAYEMVSPVEKGGDVFTIPVASPGELPRIDQADPRGEALTYSSLFPFGDASSAPWSSQYIATRTAGGWSSRAISPPREGRVFGGDAGANGKTSPFYGFGEDLCSSWLVQDDDRSLAPGAVPGYPDAYRRSDCGEEGYTALSTVTPPSWPPPGFKEELIYWPYPAGFSADGAHTILGADDRLTPGASDKMIEGKELGKERPIFQLYEAGAGGVLRLVSVLPNKASAAGAAAGGDSVVGTEHLGEGKGPFYYYRRDSVYHAVSEDGSRVYWSALTKVGERQVPVLYLRVNPDREQSKVASRKCTEAEKACTYQVSELAGRKAEAAFFWAARPDGSAALFSAEEEGETSLYLFDAEKEAVEPIAGQFVGVMGASQDLSRVYLVSREDLDGAGPAAAGAPNLYLYRAGQGFRFIAALSEGALHGDLGGGDITAPPSPIAALPMLRSARVAPDGLHAAFMSNSPALAQATAGYDNTDVSSPSACGQPEGRCDAEVYLYDAAADGGEGELLCASCNPTGARPTGANLIQNESSPYLAAAHIPGWETQWRPSRLLSANGRRLFFDSSEALVPEDTNGHADVYEWEAPGEGDCSAADPTYSPARGGCVRLISSGQGARDSELIEAGEAGEGRDVFFFTPSSLVPQDPGEIDVYDARQGGGFPPPSGGDAGCEGEACQSPPPPPADTTPASSAFEGAGNVREAKPKPKCKKGKVRRHGKCVKKAHHRKHKAHKRKHHAKRHHRAASNNRGGAK